MTMLRYEPWGLNRELWNEFNRFFERASQDGSSGATAEWLPAVDIEEHGDKYVLHADIPGVDPANIEITLENGVLTLAGSREQTVQQNGTESRRLERVSGRFLRRFTLPDSVDADAVKATGRHGVLEVVIPKRAAAQPRRIAVSH